MRRELTSVRLSEALDHPSLNSARIGRTPSTALGQSLPGLDSAAIGYLIGLLLAGGCSSWPLTDQSRGLLTES